MASYQVALDPLDEDWDHGRHTFKTRHAGPASAQAFFDARVAAGLYARLIVSQEHKGYGPTVIQVFEGS